MPNPVIERLESQRQEQLDAIDFICNRAAEDGRDLVDAETANVTASRDRVRAIDAQLEPLREFEELRGAHRSSGPSYRPTDGGESRGTGLATRVESRPYEYRSPGEYLADGFRAANPDRQLPADVVERARARLETVGASIAHDGMLVRASAPHTTTAEIPGLLPTPILGPVWSNIDAARPFVSSIGVKDLGGIAGSVFKRPKITTHLTVGAQSAEKAELEDGQFIVGSVSFTKETAGGWTNISRQAIDWSSPAAWDAIMSDFQEQYALYTENKAADAFVTAVTAATATVAATGTTATAQEWVQGLYDAALLSYAGSGRLPDTVWVSLDQWAVLGVLTDQLRSNTAGVGLGDSQIGQFQGGILGLNRVVVPSFASGTVIVGNKRDTEFYEDRIGFLSAVEPKVLGVELAYGGYIAYGTLHAASFAKVTFT